MRIWTASWRATLPAQRLQPPMPRMGMEILSPAQMPRRNGTGYLRWGHPRLGWSHHLKQAEMICKLLTCQ